MVVSIIVCLALAIGFLAYKVTGVPDSPAEQVCEIIIKEETGIEIDISPDIKK